MTLSRLVIRFSFFFILLLFVSCGTRKQFTPESPQADDLSQLYGIRITNEDNVTLYTEAAQWMGVPHRYGGADKKGVDCSGFVAILYQKVYDRKLSRSSADMLKHDCRKISRSKLREGDLVFFRTESGRKKLPNHAGIYLKNDKFIHTSTSRGVMVSSLNEPYYLRTWISGGRVK